MRTRHLVVERLAEFVLRSRTSSSFCPVPRQLVQDSTTILRRDKPDKWFHPHDYGRLYDAALPAAVRANLAACYGSVAHCLPLTAELVALKFHGLW